MRTAIDAQIVPVWRIVTDVTASICPARQQSGINAATAQAEAFHYRTSTRVRSGMAATPRTVSWPSGATFRRSPSSGGRGGGLVPAETGAVCSKGCHTVAMTLSERPGDPEDDNDLRRRAFL
jgi:hypothetical protein